MKDYYFSDVLAEKRRGGEIKVGFKNRIRIKNSAYDRPIKVFFITALLLSLISIFSLDIEWAIIIERFSDLGDVFIQLSKFNFANFNFVTLAFLESVNVTVLATIYSVIFGLVMAAFISKNIAPNQKLSVFLSALNSFIRAVPTPVWVLIFIACLGFGPAPGIVGLSLHATAFFARAFAQSFEEVPVETIEALRSTGAGRVHIFFGALLPASLTSLVAWIAMRFEINFSESAILGMVGGGGIGYSIASSISGYNFGRAGVSILMVLLFAFILEITFASIKRKLKV